MTLDKTQYLLDTYNIEDLLSLYYLNADKKCLENVERGYDRNAVNEATELFRKQCHAMGLDRDRAEGICWYIWEHYKEFVK